jgi:D-xylose 1-dehydrogenase (NADP+, D-xylono-1,5-lactone-forming)
MASPNKPVRWGVLGAGRIAEGVLPRIADASGCVVTAVASRDLAKARAMAQRTGRIGDPSAAACAYDDLLTRDDVDAVYVTLPNHLHFAWCQRLLRSGKHVLCEKPMVATRREAEALRDVASSRGVAIVEGFMWMHHPQTLRLEELAQAGDASPIGRLLKIRSHRNVRTTDAYILATRLSHAMQGGALMDIGCYPISAAMLLAGAAPDWSTLRARADLAPPLPGETRAVDDTIEFAWTFNNGVEFEGEASFSRGTGVFLELVGTRGVARTTFPYSPDPVRQPLVVAGSEELIEHGGERFTNQFTHFAAALRAQQQSSHGSAAVRPGMDLSIRIADAIERIHQHVGIVWDHASARRA